MGDGGASLVLQVAVARERSELDTEQLVVSAAGGAVETTEVAIDSGHGGRYHLLRAPAGELTVHYEASVRPTSVAPPTVDDLLDPEVVAQLRPEPVQPVRHPAVLRHRGARAAPRRPGSRPAAVAGWVFERVAYDIDATAPLDGAVETLLSGRGVCRDFAHLTVALCRALEIPARLVAVYAPGLSPMDFHAVAEVLVQGEWQVLDATRLAPRGSLVRIATGRDAADTAFATTLHGQAELLSSEVWAIVDGDLPARRPRGPDAARLSPPP